MPSSLTELMTLVHQVLEFRLFTIKQTAVTPASILMFLAILGGFALLERWIVRRLLTRVLTRTKIEEGLQYTLTRVTHYLILVLAVVVAFQFIGVDFTGIIVIFGFLSVGIGFGLQNVTSNFVSGLILLLERPVKVGDRISMGDVEGDVIEIKIRSTVVRSLNNISIIVPNSSLVSESVVNWSHGDLKVRLDLDVGVSYGSDLDTVLRCLNEVAAEHPEVMKSPAPEVLFLGFGDSSWDMGLRAWIPTPKRHPIVRSDLNCAIVRKFRENGVEIPFPQRDLHVRSPLPVPVASTT